MYVAKESNVIYLLESITYEKLKGYFGDTKIRKAICKLSPVGQTSRIESYHRVVLSFAPKHLSFGFHGMNAR